MSAGIRQALRGNKAGHHWERLVGYTLSDLMLHLESQFTRRMTWNNRHRWHIDHIQPLASFSFEIPDDPDFKAAWALTNLRPLWKPANLLKGGKRTLLL